MTNPALLQQVTDDPMMMAFMEGAPEPTSIEVENRMESVANDLQVPELTPEIKEMMTVLYGGDFPLLDGEDATEDKWAAWVQNRWTSLGSGVQRIMHLVERNRLFRQGLQWISSNGFGPWREPPRPRDAARAVDNMIAPALAQRMQIISEQRPGFRVKPATSDPDDMKRAEAKQVALEYQYDQQQMESLVKELSWWSGTDGVTFLELYWDPQAGPWHEVGYGQTEDPNGQPSGPMGDVRSRVRRIEQVRVSPNATATQKPWYWIIKDVMTKDEAVRTYGIDVADDSTQDEASSSLFSNYPMIRLGYILPQVDELKNDQPKVDRYTIYIERSLGLPQGMTMVVVADKVVFQGPLLCGVVPMVRWSDGAGDPSFFNQAEMNLWIDSQMRVNAVLSKWVENVRLNAGAKLLAKENAIATETFTAANMSVISARGLGGLSEIVKPLESFSIGVDAKELLAMERKKFEDLSGWNDVSRGQIAADQSGRAILAIREQLERVFAPMINAAARAMTDWARISCAWMAWGYDYERIIGMEGKGRPDLGRAVQADDFDGVTDVFIDPETLMPMPRALRLFLLKEMYEMGLMGAQEYRRRMPFAWTRDIASPDEDQEARAKRVAEAMRNGQELPLLWQDNEAIHQDTLERELILPDDTPLPIRQAAVQRWFLLADQAAMKAAGMGPPTGGSALGGGAPPQGGNTPPTQRPFGGTNPGIAAQQGGVSDQDRVARQFDSQQTQMGQP